MPWSAIAFIPVRYKVQVFIGVLNSINSIYRYICRVGQNHIYGLYTVFWQGNHRIYGHKRCIYTVLANPIYMQLLHIHNIWPALCSIPLPSTATEVNPCSAARTHAHLNLNHHHTHVPPHSSQHSNKREINPCPFARTHACTSSRMHACTHAHSIALVHASNHSSCLLTTQQYQTTVTSCTYAQIHKRTHTHKYTHTRLHTRTPNTHTYTHTHTHLLLRLPVLPLQLQRQRWGWWRKMQTEIRWSHCLFHS